MNSRENEVRRAFRKQAAWCEKLGSPFTARLCQALGDGLDRETAVARLLLDWPGQPDALGDSVPLRIAGGLHALVRAGRDPHLARLYPPAALTSEAQLWPAVAASFIQHEEFLLRWMLSAPQTNEVTRSAALFAGLCVVAAATDLPLTLCEVGASAGLNLNLDHYGYRFAGEVYGDPASSLQLEPKWHGPLPPKAQVHIAARRGVDLNPLDVDLDEACKRLMAYIWPDQPDRIARMEKAIEIARAHPVHLDRSDAADWVEVHLSGEGKNRTCRVLLHSIAYQYFPSDSKARIAETMQRSGKAATPDSPLAWLAFEADPLFEDKPSLRLTLWPGGEERVLALGSPHGQWIEWKGP